MKSNLSLLMRILPLVFAITFIYSCSNNPSNNEENTNDTVTTTSKTPVEINTQYKLPLPVELYEFLVEAKANYNGQSLNPITNVSKYISSESKTINFGIYASDLAYCTSFGKNQETFKYFSTCKKIADELGLIEGFDQKVVSRIDKSINNKDSLYQITKNSYSDVINVLQSQGKIKLLPLIVTGAWLESVYISINSVNKFSPENKIVLRIAEQQLLLENLIDYFKSIPEEDQNKDVFNKLIDLQKSYDKLYDNTDEIITKAQYNEISKKVIALRTEFINK